MDVQNAKRELAALALGLENNGSKESTEQERINRVTVNKEWELVEIPFVKYRRCNCYLCNGRFNSSQRIMAYPEGQRFPHRMICIGIRRRD
jgi:hypothetical protein